jgi:16S rRNA (guanine527-N7)-methyltransferase
LGSPADIVFKYFPELLEDQRKEQVLRSFDLYKEWNDKINLISRKDIDSFYEKHFLHSLSIAKFVQFRPSTKILDVGTGGGFPGIPLAIYFPEVEFHLVDSIAKKIGVVYDVAQQLGLKNVKAECCRCETLDEKYDFVTSRAVAPTLQLAGWNVRNISKLNKNKILNGFILLKGGDLTEELAQTNFDPKIVQLSDYFDEPFFKEEKKLVYLKK